MVSRDVDEIYNNATASSMLCMPYIIGARLQIERYIDAQRFMQFDPINAGYRCLHEVSALFEDLDMLRRYLESLNISLWDERLKIQDLRDAIRHDTRKEINNPNNNKRRQKRAENLQTASGFLFNIYFHDDGITVGGHKVEIKSIYHYINSAERVLNARALGVEVMYKSEVEGDKR